MGHSDVSIVFLHRHLQFGPDRLFHKRLENSAARHLVSGTGRPRIDVVRGLSLHASLIAMSDIRVVERVDQWFLTKVHTNLRGWLGQSHGFAGRQDTHPTHAAESHIDLQ